MFRLSGTRRWLFCKYFVYWFAGHNSIINTDDVCREDEAKEKQISIDFYTSSAAKLSLRLMFKFNISELDDVPNETF